MMLIRLFKKIGQMIEKNLKNIIYIIAASVAFIIIALLIRIPSSSLALVPAFFVAFLVFIAGNYFWKVLTSPVLEIRKGEPDSNGHVNTTFYPIFVKNVGRGSCKNALMKVYLQCEEASEPVVFVPKWGSSPEPFTKYYFERAPGTNGEDLQIRIDSEGPSPLLLSNASQALSIPPMPKGDDGFVGERADLFFWDCGGSTSLRVVGESGNKLVSIPPGVKKFSVTDFCLRRIDPSSLIKNAKYVGKLYVIGDDYCGVCEITIEKWPEPNRNAEVAELVALSGCLKFSLTPTKVKGVKSIRIV